MQLDIGGGQSLHVEVTGAGGRTPLVLLHGFTGSGQAWDQDAVRTLGEDRLVFLVDLLGHGASARCERPGGYGLLPTLGALDRVREAVRVSGPSETGPPVLMGYSMGGRLALASALERPGAWSGLILESASPGLRTAVSRALRRAQDDVLARQLDEGSLEAFVDAWRARPLFAGQAARGEAWWARDRARRLTNHAPSLAASLRGQGTGSLPSFWHRLQGLVLPTLLLTGEQDVRFCHTARAMARAAPEARHEVVPGVGHAVHAEAPAAWARRIRLWLEGEQGTAPGTGNDRTP